MKNDFEPVVDHKFNLRGDWGAVDCQVLKIQPHKTLSYSWAAHGFESVVTWTLTPTSKGTNLRMEQSGFRRGSGAVLSGRQDGMGQLLRQARAGAGAGRVRRTCFGALAISSASALAPAGQIHKRSLRRALD